MSDLRKNETLKAGENPASNGHILNEVASVAPSDTSNSPAVSGPLWMKERMEALRAMPRPTLEKMRTQFKASAEARERSNDKGDS